jgi:signal peptidase I
VHRVLVELDTVDRHTRCSGHRPHAVQQRLERMGTRRRGQQGLQDHLHAQRFGTRQHAKRDSELYVHLGSAEHIMRRLGRAAQLSVRSAGLLATAWITLVLTLISWTLLPLALGWESLVVMTGSMQPTVSPGDVIVAQPIDSKALAPGQVVVVNDPNRPGQHLTHRLVRFDEDGALVLKGDANRLEDSTLVQPDQVVGVARLLVPKVGLPKVWLANHRYTPIVILLIVTSTALWARPRVRPKHLRRSKAKPSIELNTFTPSVVETPEVTASAHEIFRRAIFDDASRFDNKYAISDRDSRQPMSNDDGGAVGEERTERRLHAPF